MADFFLFEITGTRRGGIIMKKIPFVLLAKVGLSLFCVRLQVEILKKMNELRCKGTWTLCHSVVFTLGPYFKF